MRLPKELEASLAEPAVDAVFGEAEVDGLPDAVKKYFFAAIAPGTPREEGMFFRYQVTDLSLVKTQAPA
jgi:hypothetical protein